MDDSILNGTKKALGVDASYDVFDHEIIMHINSTFSTLHQLGVGPTVPFVIKDNNDQWDSFIKDNPTVLQSVKTYMQLKVKLLFDPPSSSFALESFRKQAEEFEWRLNFHAEGVTTND